MTLNLKSSLFSIEWGTTRSAPLLRERDKTASRSLSGRGLNHPPSQRNTHTHTRRVIVQPLSKVKSFHRRQCEKSEREEDDVSPLCVGLDQTKTHKTTTGQVRFPIPIYDSPPTPPTVHQQQPLLLLLLVFAGSLLLTLWMNRPNKQIFAQRPADDVKLLLHSHNWWRWNRKCLLAWILSLSLSVGSLFTRVRHCPPQVEEEIQSASSFFDSTNQFWVEALPNEPPASPPLGRLLMAVRLDVHV
jgi:hypothetical protein